MMDRTGSKTGSGFFERHHSGGGTSAHQREKIKGKIFPKGLFTIIRQHNFFPQPICNFVSFIH